jgi:hypothetical protein
MSSRWARADHNRGEWNETTGETRRARNTSALDNPIPPPIVLKIVSITVAVPVPAGDTNFSGIFHRNHQGPIPAVIIRPKINLRLRILTLVYPYACVSRKALKHRSLSQARCSQLPAAPSRHVYLRGRLPVIQRKAGLPSRTLNAALPRQCWSLCLRVAARARNNSLIDSGCGRATASARRRCYLNRSALMVATASFNRFSKLPEFSRRLAEGHPITQPSKKFVATASATCLDLVLLCLSRYNGAW